MAIFNFDKLEQSNQTQRKNLGESEFKSQSVDFLRKILQIYNGSN